MNPVNPNHTPGGSSSGSAAGVGAGLFPLAFGTQTAGSVIRPAAFCGVVGYKPTFGLISRVGMKIMSDSLDTVGVFARTVADCALFASAVSGRDLGDPDSAAGAITADRHLPFTHLEHAAAGDPGAARPRHRRTRPRRRIGQSPELPELFNGLDRGPSDCHERRKRARPGLGADASSRPDSATICASGWISAWSQIRDRPRRCLRHVRGHAACASPMRWTGLDSC